MKGSLRHAGAVPTAAKIVGIVSMLVRWLVIVATPKYVVLLLRPGNDGEGGMIAFIVLNQRALAPRSTLVLFLCALGAALF